MIMHVRQRLNWESGDISFAALERARHDIRTAKQDLTDAGVEREAGLIWESDCFTLELYLIGASHMTKAEAFATWLKRGYTRSHCLRYWRDREWAPAPDQTRGIDSAWKAAALQLIRDELASAAHP